MIQTMGIRTLSERTGLSAHALRYYEAEGLMIAVPRDGSGRRAYTEEHVRWVSFLMRLREAGMGISRLREYAELIRSDGDPDGVERTKLLRAHREDVRARVRSLKEHLHVLDRKIAAGCGPDRGSTRDQGGEE